MNTCITYRAGYVSGLVCFGVNPSSALRRCGVYGPYRVSADLRLNEKASSATVYYDTREISGETLLDTLRRECPQATIPTEPAAAQPALPRTYQRPIAAEIGKVALNMLVSKGVRYSLSTLLRTRI